jgi:hypothetical protein
MKTIWKFPLAFIDEQNLMMPTCAEILTAQMQGTYLCLWALVDPKAPKQRRVIEVLGTGNPVSEANRRYIATVQMVGGLVWHIFEKLVDVDGATR